MTAEPIDLTLLPSSTTIDGAGRTAVGGCDLVELADRFGTPLYVYDELDVRSRCRAYVSAFGPGNVAYAGKAALFGALARIVHDEGLCIDVASGGELRVPLAIGVPAERIVFHGNNKSPGELQDAVAAGVGRIVVDSHDELDRLAALAAGGHGRVPVLVRVTPGVEAHTHEFIETGTEDSKFGFSLGSGAALEAVARVVEDAALDLAGLHCHIGSQVLRLDSFAAAASRMAELVCELESRLGVEVTELGLGGGLGIRYVAADVAPSVDEYAAVLRGGVEAALGRAGARVRPRVTVEPGRSIAGPAGLTLYRVGTVKHVAGVRTYVAVDGGMSDNPRPITYGARYEVFAPARAHAARTAVATIAGKHCEQGDLIVRDAHVPPDVAVGDVLAVPATGAYTFSMASNYNRLPRPAVVVVRDGDARLAVRRETYDDLARSDTELAP
jgi:diaminopimelate decarboxylase